MSIIDEMKRRNVFRVGIAYVVLGWVVIQVTDTVAPALNLPEWTLALVTWLGIIGFPFALLLAWAFELTPEGIKLEKNVVRSESITPVTGRKLDFMIIGLLVIALGVVVWDSYLSTPEIAAPAEAPVIAAEPTTADSATASIAVLPFVDMSMEQDQAYFSDGISEELLNLLARVPGLRVAGRTSSFAFKGRNTDLREVGNFLGVETLLEGSVRKSGNTVRITAQLINVDDGFHLWSETYDRELTDVFAIQDDIAGAILAQLKPHLLDTQDAVPASTRTQSEVYDLYLLARQKIHERSEQSIESAIELLGSAIAADPGYAPAYALRGIAYLLLDVYGDISDEASDRLARRDLDRAHDLDPGLAEALAGLGLYYRDEPGEIKQAIELLEQSLAINPNLIDASNWLSGAYAYTGQSEKALPILEDIVARDPLYRPGIRNLTGMYNLLGRQDESFALLDRVEFYLANDPLALADRADTMMSLGRYAEGLQLAEEAHRLRPNQRDMAYVLSRGLMRTHQYARAAPLREPATQAPALYLLGETERAISIAQKLFEQQGIPHLLFDFLARGGRTADIVDLLESRWPTLEAFRAEYVGDNNNDYLMLRIAHAYKDLGNEERFRDAMTLVRAAHDKLVKLGVEDLYFYFYEAVYHTLAGDHETATDKLDTAIRRGFIGDLRIADGEPALEPLERDPRYQAIQARMIENLNTQRAMLGLAPAPG